jgi:hypothetical protein
VLRDDPDHLEARLGLARVVAWDGDLDRAEKLYDEILEEEPENRAAVMGKIQVLHWGGRPLGTPSKTGPPGRTSEDARPPATGAASVAPAGNPAKPAPMHAAGSPR